VNQNSEDTEFIETERCFCQFDDCNAAADVRSVVVLTLFSTLLVLLFH